MTDRRNRWRERMIACGLCRRCGQRRVAFSEKTGERTKACAGCLQKDADAKYEKRHPGVQIVEEQDLL